MSNSSEELQRLPEQVDALDGDQRRLLSLVEILRDITGAIHYPDIVQVVTRRLGHLFALDRCSVFLAARAGGPDVHLVASYEDPSIRNHLVDLGRYPEVRQALDTGKVVFIPDALAEPALAASTLPLASRQAQSIAVVPLLWQHGDVHGGNAGVQCSSCHDTDEWKSRFDADAHRRTNFPLQGRHALLPCEQCHGDRRDRSFARPTVACWECHQSDLTSASARGVDHSAFPGYPQLACLGCNGFWRWSPGPFTGHGACFPIDSGKHAGIPCMQCHVTLPVPFVIGSCTSQPYPSCIRCHPCATHPQVQSFVCADQNCYGCHYNGQAEGSRRLRSRGQDTSCPLTRHVGRGVRRRRFPSPPRSRN